MSALDQVLEAIDHLNASDPRRSPAGDEPYELWYSKRLSDWVLRLRPQASEALRIAARGQHVARWTLPRERYPMDRTGYLRWREELKRFHAQTVAQLMQSAGYPPGMIDEARQIILKKSLAENVEAQTLEDALCLLFIETQFDDLERKTPADKMVEIVRKTWKKMSEQGRAEALRLPLSARQKEIVSQALHV